MSLELPSLGALSLTRCYAACDACHRVKAGVQFTGLHGYVTLCDACQLAAAVILIEEKRANGS